MTIATVRYADTCGTCQALVRVYQVLQTGRFLVRDCETGEPHVCVGESGPLEEIDRVTLCERCAHFGPAGELLGNVALTSWGRVIEWYPPFPVPPYQRHVCVTPEQSAQALRLDIPVLGQKRSRQRPVALYVTDESEL